MVDIVTQLEIAAVVERAAIRLLDDVSSPALGGPVAAERVHDDVAKDSLASVERDTCRSYGGTILTGEPRDPHRRTQLDRRFPGSGSAERPLDDRPSDPEVDKILVARLRFASKPRSDILHLCAGVHERRKHVRREARQHEPSTREERVRLKEVRNSTPFFAERRHRVSAQTCGIAFQDDGLVACTRHRQRSSQPSHSSTGHDKSHQREHNGEPCIRATSWLEPRQAGGLAGDASPGPDGPDAPRAGSSEAAGQGLEPRLPDPESGVLPLDDPAKGRHIVPKGLSAPGGLL